LSGIASKEIAGNLEYGKGACYQHKLFVLAQELTHHSQTDLLLDEKSFHFL
jgi:hypothetical protein